jgi:hypothetical protein
MTRSSLFFFVAVGCSPPPLVIDGATLSVPAGGETASLTVPARPTLPLPATDLSLR